MVAASTKVPEDRQSPKEVGDGRLVVAHSAVCIAENRMALSLSSYVAEFPAQLDPLQADADSAGALPGQRAGDGEVMQCHQLLQKTASLG